MRRTSLFLVLGIVLASLLVVAILGGGVPRLRPGPRAAATGDSELNWTNGVLNASLASGAPMVAVGPTAARSYGMWTALDSVSELTPDGQAAAVTSDTATFSGPNVTVRGSTTTLEYQGSVPVRTVGSPASVVGNARLLVNYTGTSAAGATARGYLGVDVGILHWPWTHAGDSLVLSLSLWPDNASSEGLTTASGDTINCTWVHNATPVEYFWWNATVTGRTAGGSTVSAPVAGSASGLPNGTTVELRTGSGAAGATELHLAARIGVVLSTPVLGVPLYQYLLAGFAGGVVVAVAGVGLRRARRRPWQLGASEEAE